MSYIFNVLMKRLDYFIDICYNKRCVASLCNAGKGIIIMKKLWIYMRGYRRDCVLSPLFKLLEALLELMIPLIVKDIIDNGVGTGDGGHIWRSCGLMALLGAVGLAFSITAQYFSARASVGFAGAIRRELFAHVLSYPRSEADLAGGSSLVTRLTADADKLQSGVNLGLRLLLRSPFIVFGSVVMAFTVDARLALIFCGLVPVLAAVIFALILSGIPLYARVQSKLDSLTGTARDNLRGTRVIRAFRQESEETERFDAQNIDYTRASLFAGRISALLNPMTYVIVNIGIILLVRRGAPAVDTGRITQGELIALYNYMAQILTELVKLANLIVTLSRAGACAGRIAKALDRPAEELAPAPAPEAVTGAPAVEFRGVSFAYAGAGADSLDDITFSVMPGETVGILGGTGSGKTTLIDLIPRFYEPTEGSILIDGVPAEQYPAAALRQKIGIVPQSAMMFTGTVRSNLLWGKPDATDEEMKKALEAACALDFVNAKSGSGRDSMAFDAPVEQGGKNFSGGQRQRLTIARALIRDPEILILDDSFSALDYATDLKLRTNIAASASRPATFIVTQRPASVINADKIIVLEDGRAVGIGTHEELLAGCEVYREIYESQYGGDDAASDNVNVAGKEAR